MRNHLLTVGASGLFGSLLLLTEPFLHHSYLAEIRTDNARSDLGNHHRGTRLVSLQGEVEDANASGGVLTVRFANSIEEIFGAPWQISRHRVGDIVSLTLRHYGEKRWLWPHEKRWSGAFDMRGTLTGPIEEIDDHRSVVRLGGKILHAHPEQLRALSLGERATLYFGRVGRRWWMIDRDEPKRDREDESTGFAASISSLFERRMTTLTGPEDH